MINDVTFDIDDAGILVKRRQRSGSQAFDDGVNLMTVKSEATFINRAMTAGVSVPQVISIRPDHLEISMQHLADKMMAIDYLMTEGIDIDKSMTD